MARPIEVKIYDMKEFDKKMLDRAIKVIKGKAKLISLKELEEE